MENHTAVRVAIFVALGLLTAINPPLASADTILTYTGNMYQNFFDDPAIPGTYLPSMSVTANIQLDTQLV